MTVQELKKEQFEELRGKLENCCSLYDIEATGADVNNLTETDIYNILSGIVSDEVIKKAFSGIDFVNDDFFCSVDEE